MKLNIFISQTFQRLNVIMHSWHFWLFFSSLLALIFLGLFFRKPQVPTQETTTTVATAICTEIEDVVSAGGVLQPFRLVNVGADASGLMKDMLVEIGSSVNADQLLATIDPSVQTQLVKSSQFEVDNAQLQLQSSELQLRDAKLEAQRQKNMFAASAASDFSLKDAQSKLTNAEIGVESARNRLNQAQAKLNIEATRLSHTKILSPWAGVVTEILIRPGESVTNVQQIPTILRIADLSRMIVNVQVPQVDIGAIYVGMPTRFQLLGNTSDSWSGRVEHISPIPKQIMGINSYTVSFHVDNPKNKLMPGMQVQTFFVRESASEAVTIPLAALQIPLTMPPSNGMTAQVRVQTPDGQVSLRSVVLGVVNRQIVQVRQGLHCGEKVQLDLKTH